MEITTVTLDRRDVMNARIGLMNLYSKVEKMRKYDKKTEDLIRIQKTLDKFKNLSYVEIKLLVGP